MVAKRQLRERWKVEPGLTIRQRIIDYLCSTNKWNPNVAPQVNIVSQTVDSNVVFGLLDGLPFRDEVAHGRDLRGADFGSGWRSDFSEADFSYSLDIGSFFHCDLSSARFDEITARRCSFRGTLVCASFRKAKLRSCYILESDVRNCCFDGANLDGTDFSASDLSGSSFRDANCNGAVFANADLRRCDFRGASLHEASFQDARIDKSTDFRGASLINAYHDDRFDNAGNLIGHGVDLRQATYDELTEFGKDPLAFPLEVKQRAIEIAMQEYGADGLRIAAFIKRLTEQMLAEGGRSPDWENEQLAQLDPGDRAIYDQIMDDTFKSLL